MADSDKPAPVSAPVVRAVTDWARIKGVSHTWLYAAALGNRWEIADNVIPTSVTEAAFDDAIYLAMHCKPRPR